VRSGHCGIVVADRTVQLGTRGTDDHFNRST
jgi:hypothetical protein